MNALIFRPNFSTQSTNATSSSTTDIYKLNNGVQKYISHANNTSSTQSNGYNGSANLVARHRFKKPGQTISVDLSWTGSSNNNNGNYFNNINIVDSAREKITNQQYTADSRSYTLSGTLSYTQPIAKTQQLELRYNHAYTNTVSNKTTYDFDSTTMAYDKENISLTNSFVNDYTADVVTLGYHLNNQKINFNVSNGIQFGYQNSINSTKDYTITRNYTNIYPTVNFRYVFTKTSNIRFNYTGRTGQPSITQLQPLTDSSDGLNITAGNPNLKQSFSQSLRAQYSSFNREKNINMFAAVNFSTTQNAITSAITRLSNGGQRSQPINMNGNYNLNAYFNFGFPLKKPKSNFNFVTNLSTNKGTSLLIVQDTLRTDSTYNISRSYSMSETFKWTTNLDSLFDINFFTTPSYTINKYTASSATNPNYFSQNIGVEATWYTRSGWVWSNSFNYTYYKGLYSTSVPIWNSSFSKLIFKKKQGEIKLAVSDLLNKNKGISQTANAFSIQQTTTTVLRRYVLLTFTYNIRNFAGRNTPSSFGDRREGGGGRRGGGGGFGGGRDF
jgi:hypothetical protein